MDAATNEEWFLGVVSLDSFLTKTSQLENSDSQSWRSLSRLLVYA
ncbi:MULTISPECIES: hypothetical protein [unclassified Tolypothrix]|nr:MULTISPECIES: hypothetical protein [unclassified Tolypothrix]EKE99103.1 hypothetical protein FDUTEX481_03295 [Tolypothrix sp. PCC 7601]